MVNNQVTALNTAVGNASSQNAAATTNTLDPEAASAGAGAPGWIDSFCQSYGEILLYAGLAFVALALVLGAASAIVALRKAAAESPADRAGPAQDGLPDPTKFMDALKGLIDALANAPAWFALFLGGVLLFWMAGTLAGEVCTREGNDSNANEVEANGSGGSSGSSANNTQSAANLQQAAPGNSSTSKDGR